MSQHCPLLNLPREVLDHIIGELFFPGERDPASYEQDAFGLAWTATRQIMPYNIDRDKKRSFDVAIMRTCGQLRREAEEVLYGTSSWNLMYQDWLDSESSKSFEFFARMPKRHRRLIRRVERKCYSRRYTHTISLFDWCAFMKFLAMECPRLQILKLWGPGDRYEGSVWVNTCNKEEEWVQAILQIKTLRYFDIPVIKGGVIYKYSRFKEDFLLWLKTELIQQSRGDQMSTQPNSAHSMAVHNKPFRFFALPEVIRRRVYRQVLLPPNGRVHMMLKPWYDQTTQNVLPLFLTCKQIYLEASKVLYGEAVFTCPTNKYDNVLTQLLVKHFEEGGQVWKPRMPAQIKRLRVDETVLTRSSARLPRYAIKNFRIEYMEMVITDHATILTLNRNARPLRGYGCRIGLLAAEVPRFVMEMPKGHDLDPELLDLLTNDIRGRWLRNDSRDRVLRILRREGLDEYIERRWEDVLGEQLAKESSVTKTDGLTASRSPKGPRQKLYGERL